MKILFLTGSLEMGGIETNLVQLTQVLSAEHDVLVASRPGVLVGALQRSGGRHLELDASLAPTHLLRAAMRLKDIIETERPNVVHSFSASSSCVLWVALNVLRARRDSQAFTITSSVMGLQQSPDEGSAMTWLRVYLTTLCARKVIVISPAIRKILHRSPVRATRLVEMPVVGVGIPDEGHAAAVRSKVRSDLALSDDEILVLTVGNLEARKSHELFIQAAALAAKKVPTARFVIAGEGPLRWTLQQAIDSSGVNERISLVGQIEPGRDLIAAADIYIRPGIVEGFVGITVLEAQALRVPVISFETEDVKLAIRHGETGMLVRNGDADELGEMIARLATDKDLRERLAKAAFAHVDESFSVEAVADNLVAFYLHQIGVV